MPFLFRLQECDRLVAELERIAEVRIEEFRAKAAETKKTLIKNMESGGSQLQQQQLPQSVTKSGRK